MMKCPDLPDHVTRIAPGDTFRFLCHQNIACFTDCCRQLELALTPYDVLRLRYAKKLSSAELIEQFIIIEKEREELFPRYYLTMVDDGEASCAFVTSTGCSIYEHRPGACRTYPMGRGVISDQNNRHEVYVLLREPHCQGFLEVQEQTISSYSASQDLEKYNMFNDLLSEIQQHPAIRTGMAITPTHLEKYHLALYDIDTFRKKMIASPPPGQQRELTFATIDDEQLLRYSFQWLKAALFGQR